jgi:hypothetical protein
MLAERNGLPVFGPWLEQEWCVYVFVFGGLFFDLLVVPALLVDRLRLFACVCAIAFHLTNSMLFPIGVFPWFMLLTLPLYFPPGSLRRLLFPSSRQTDPADHGQRDRGNRGLALVLAVYVLWQVLFPLRHYAIPGNPSWTEEGHCFAWHMLVRGKRSGLRIVARDPRTGQSGAVDLRPYVTEFQLKRVSRDPRLIHELALYIAEDLRTLGFEGVEVRALALVSLNGRKPQLLIDPDVDLARQEQTWRTPSWIVPLREPLPETPWNVPLSEWEHTVKTTLD